MKIWKDKPSKQAVEDLLKTYFQHLQNGEIDKALSLTSNAYDDWEDTLYVVWQDHYLIHEIPKDNTFEGREWINDLGWLKDLTIQPTPEWLSDDMVWVDFVYRGEPSGYIGEFRVIKNDEGYHVERTIFKMA